MVTLNLAASQLKWNVAATSGSHAAVLCQWRVANTIPNRYRSIMTTHSVRVEGICRRYVSVTYLRRTISMKHPRLLSTYPQCYTCYVFGLQLSRGYSFLKHVSPEFLPFPTLFFPPRHNSGERSHPCLLTARQHPTARSRQEAPSPPFPTPPRKV